jgi:hypothetical protein
MDIVIVRQESVCAILDFLVQIVLLTHVLSLDASMVIVLLGILDEICLLQINHVFASMGGMVIDVMQPRHHFQCQILRRRALTDFILIWIAILPVDSSMFLIHQIQQLAVLHAIRMQPVIHGFLRLMFAI